MHTNDLLTKKISFEKELLEEKLRPRKPIAPCVTGSVISCFFIGSTGFEPATSASRTQRSARLSYDPQIHILKLMNPSKTRTNPTQQRNSYAC